MFAGLIQILPTLLHLKDLFISNMSLGGLQLQLSPDMNSLYYVVLSRVSVRFSVLTGLVDSVSQLPQPVIVTLMGCTVTPPEEYKSIKTEIKEIKT
jgi:hypothetical protein